MARTDPYSSGQDMSQLLGQLNTITGGTAQSPSGGGGSAGPPTGRLTQYNSGNPTAWQSQVQANPLGGSLGGNLQAGSASSAQTTPAPLNSMGLPSAPGVVDEPTSGQNSLTQLLTSLNNLLGNQGQQATQQGTSILGSGLNTTQAGLGVTQSGLGVTQSGLNTTQQGLSLQSDPIAYYQAILSGNPSNNPTLQQAISPEVAAIGAQYGSLTQGSSANLPAGGYRATSIADAPAAQAGAVSNLYAQEAAQVPAAAQALSGIGSSVAGTGTAISGTGTAISGTGTNVSATGNATAQTGISQENAGITELVAAINAALGKNTINMQQQNSNISNLTSGLAALI